MTNSVLLKEKIQHSGLKMIAICHCVGVTYGPLKRKINGDVEFKASEISALCRLLGISEQERTAIFFA